MTEEKIKKNKRRGRAATKLGRYRKGNHKTLKLQKCWEDEKKYVVKMKRVFREKGKSENR